MLYNGVSVAQQLQPHRQAYTGMIVKYTSGANKKLPYALL